MRIIYKLGIVVIILGVLMFILAASTFSYTGNINPWLSKIGMISFVIWLPTLLIGIILFIIGNLKRKASLISKESKENKK
jgi:hypothetical protein